jgi:hypothetical protein
MSESRPTLWTLDPPWTPQCLRLIYLLVLAFIAVSWVGNVWDFLRRNVWSDLGEPFNDALWLAIQTFGAVVAALAVRLLGEVFTAVFQILAHQRAAHPADPTQAPTRPLHRKEDQT